VVPTSDSNSNSPKKQTEIDPSTYPSTENNITTVKNNELQTKNKKIKKKKSAYKRLLKQAKTSKYTDSEKEQNYRNKISKSLGGGIFSKSTKL
jgi:hypothetical protein